jgi:serine/threonine protein kinase/tetratricopeptide (TPR) repeat protein
MDFRRVQELLLQVREVPSSERAAWLAEHCAGDAALRAEIESLLEHDAGEPRWLSPGAAGEALVRRLEAEAMPERIGPYRLLEVLGEGGMGIVYRARQEEPLPRDVALKRLRIGAISPSARLRFDFERAVLARLEHPGIAQVYDAGSDEQGRPWVAMEFVSGEPITRWCDHRRARLRERVELVREVCAAMQHAHQKGILHRDLKPSNILVDLRDGRPSAQVIDFGIAKALDASLDGATLAGELLGTPQYMSPEQAGAGVGAVDTRSDLYSLGVVLYELLVGDTPLGRQTLNEQGLAATLVLLREREVMAPSQRLRSAAAADQESVAAARSTRPQALARELRGDLDAIVTRALEREPARRYDSMTALSEDMRRWLCDEPVAAAPPGLRRRLAALARRHRMAAAALLSGTAVLFAGLTTTLWQAALAQRERATAEQRLEDIRTFVLDLVFELDERISTISGTLDTRRYLAEQTVQQLRRISEDQAAREGLRLTLAGAYRKLGSMQREFGDLAAADSSQAAAEQLLREELAAKPDALEVRRQLAVVADYRATLLGLSGDSHAALVKAQEALQEFEAIAKLDPTGKQTQLDLNVIRSSVAAKLIGLGRREEGLGLHELSLAGRRQYVQEHPADLEETIRLAREIRRIAGFWEDDGRTDLSDPMYAEMLALHRSVYERDPTNLEYKREFATALHAAGRHQCIMKRIEDGLALMKEARRLREEIVLENPGQLRHVSALITTLCTIGETEYMRSHFQAALPYYLRADSLSTEADRAGPGNAVILRELAWIKQLIARVHMELNEFSPAERYYLAGIERLSSLPEDAAGSSTWRRASIECDLGEMYARRARSRRGAEPAADWHAAQEWHRRGLARMHRMQENDLLAQWQADELPWRRREAAAADSAVAALSQG